MDGSETETQKTQDLDSILNEYETKTQPAPAKVEVDGLQEAVAFINDVKAEKEQSHIKESVNKIIGESGIDYDVAYGYLLAKANSDSAIDEAYKNSLSNPKEWEKVLSNLSGELKEKFPDIDRKATEDTEEMVAAVTGSKQSTKAPDESPNYSGMSNQEFQKELDKLGITM